MTSNTRISNKTIKTPTKAGEEKGKENVTELDEGNASTRIEQRDPSWDVLDEGESEVDSDCGQKVNNSGPGTSDVDSPLRDTDNSVMVSNAVKKRFELLYTSRRGTYQDRLDFREKYKDQKCERCTELFMDCFMPKARERQIPCEGCRKSRQSCSKVHLYRREHVMRAMKIDEEMFYSLFLDYQENLNAGEQKGRKGGRGRRDVEEDELESSDSEEEWVAKPSSKKRKNADDGAQVAAKKEVRTKPSVSPLKMEVLIVTSEKSGNRKRREDKMKQKKSPRKVRANGESQQAINSGHRTYREESDLNDDYGEDSISERGADVTDEIQILEPTTSEATIREKHIKQKEQRTGYSTRSAAASLSKSTGSNLALISAKLSTMPLVSSPPVAGILTISEPVPPATSPPVSPWQAVTTLPVTSSSLALNRNQRSTSNFTQARLHLQLVLGELGVNRIKRQVEDISSDLRYRRIAVEETLKKIDEVAVRLGKSADLWEQVNC
ncbi:hypothetical protein E1B28_003054 [Marasmius oreades]|uniref:Uncharacterized protein n=1 Tax=Marasmius oreades TaxID=181124 RepID=A0A9P7RLD2_9AGAR|nr:uncharacterized protein E1B28_003054 [Marasmius oreades]KAG7085492.1 hypothetical protein E1B28_003054 [Marasmius oreades]